MARRSLPSFAVLWKKHQMLYCDIFVKSLQRLVNEKTIKGDEDDISELLSTILPKVCLERNDSEGIEVSTPYWEAPIQPVIAGELKGGKKRKRPDFTRKVVNPWATTAEEYEIPLHIECKCLGSKTSPSWILNKNYITRGVKRFDCTTHEYGKRAFSGIMIGYIISMTPQEILKEINQYKKRYLSYIPDIAMKFNGKSVDLGRKHEFQRKNVKPNKFELTHIWADIRKNYQQ